MTFFFKGLPILGKDGTLAKIQVNSPAAGHVFAKTGTFGSEDKLNSKMMLNGKGLAAMSSPKTERNSPSPRTSITSHCPSIRTPRRKLPGRRLAKSPQPPMTPTWMPQRAPATTISSSATVTSLTAPVIPGSPRTYAVNGDRIAAIGDLRQAHAKREIDATGRIVAPGFIDMLGQSEVSLLLDNRSLSKLSKALPRKSPAKAVPSLPQKRKKPSPAKRIS